MKLVSVIIPNFNHAPYLKERIGSVLAQDYPEIEVLILDDCSTDCSMEVIESFRADKRVRLIERNSTNSGNTFVQWKKGIAAAKGDYIWIAESDDVAAPGLLTRLVGQLEQPERNGSLPTVAFAASEWIDSKGESIPRTVTTRWKRAFRMDGKQFASRFLLGYSYICNASAAVMRRGEALRVSDACLQYSSSGDRQFWLEMAMQGDVCYVPEQLNRFRQHEQKVSGPAEKAGRNIVEDHKIYCTVRGQLHLSRLRKRLICGYHLHAIRCGNISPRGRELALEAWNNEPETGRWSHMLYLLSRITERLPWSCY